MRVIAENHSVLGLVYGLTMVTQNHSVLGLVLPPWF